MGVHTYMLTEIHQPSHPKVRDDIMKFYSDILQSDFEFDYNNAAKIYHDIGNEPGIYPDVALLLFELINQYKPKKIVEIGSGFSTLVLKLAAQTINSEVISYEQSDNWMKYTVQLLQRYYIKDAIGEFNIKTNINLVQDADFVFVDFMDRQYMMENHADWFRNVDIIVYDDCTLPPNSQGLLFEFMKNSDRHNFVFYNGGGRTDRVEFVSFKNLDPEVDYFIAQKLGYL
jgi:predicted O-methyltransferase YrrM